MPPRLASQTVDSSVPATRAVRYNMLIYCFFYCTRSLPLSSSQDNVNIRTMIRSATNTTTLVLSLCRCCAAAASERRGKGARGMTHVTNHEQPGPCRRQSSRRPHSQARRVAVALKPALCRQPWGYGETCSSIPVVAPIFKICATKEPRNFCVR